jgi:formylglycine-generating enzyme required for sulfatase activity
MSLSFASTSYIVFCGLALLTCQRAPLSASVATSASPQPPTASANASPGPPAAMRQPEEWHYTVAATIGPGSEVPDAVRVRSQADCPPKMVFIPEGDLSYVGALPDKKDQTLRPQRFHVKAFCIDLTEPVNNDWDGLNGQCGPLVDSCQARGSHPMGCVTPEQAECFCEKGMRAVHKRLPTDPEWLYAALGSDDRKYPWGNQPVPSDATERNFCADRGLQPIGRFSSGRPDWMCLPILNTGDKSPFGVIGMGTNGSEMNATCVRRAEAPNAPSCLIRLADIANDEARQTPFPGLAPRTAFVYQLDPLASRVDETISFRCATSERVSP